MIIEADQPLRGQGDRIQTMALIRVHLCLSVVTQKRLLVMPNENRVAWKTPR